MSKKESGKFTQRKWLSFGITGLGVLLLFFMIFVEDEPGAVPLLLIIGGMTLYIHTKLKIRKA